MSISIEKKDVLVLGDKILTLIGIAAGTEAVTIDPGKCVLPDEIREKLQSYGVIIVSEEVLEKCKNIKELIHSYFEKTLIIVIQSPKKIGEIDYRKYYEEFVGKTIGLKISF